MDDAGLTGDAFGVEVGGGKLDEAVAVLADADG